MPEKWVPVDVPASLQHKPYTLPAIGTEPYPGRADSVLDSVWDGRQNGPLYEFAQRTRAEAWTEAVAAYEADPRRFSAAWNYLDKHPIYYRFPHAPENGTLAEIVQERHLKQDFGLYELYFRVSNWCAEACDDEDCGHPRKDICWAETGPWTWPTDKPGPHEPRTGTGVHDYRLDVYGDSYEQCIVQLACLVWKHYGNDRALDGSANTFEDGTANSELADSIAEYYDTHCSVTGELLDQPAHQGPR